jgi:O-antigen/teichoic acid export membrane protein
VVVTMGCLALEIAACIPLAAAYGLRGAAVATLGAAVLCLAGHAVLVWRRFGVLADPSRIGRLVVAASVAFAIARLATSPESVVPLSIAAFVAYAVAVAVMRVIPRSRNRSPTAA